MVHRDMLNAQYFTNQFVRNYIAGHVEITRGVKIEGKVVIASDSLFEKISRYIELYTRGLSAEVGAELTQLEKDIIKFVLVGRIYGFVKGEIKELP